MPLIRRGADAHLGSTPLLWGGWGPSVRGVCSGVRWQGRREFDTRSGWSGLARGGMAWREWRNEAVCVSVGLLESAGEARVEDEPSKVVVAGAAALVRRRRDASNGTYSFKVSSSRPRCALHNSIFAAATNSAVWNARLRGRKQGRCHVSVLLSGGESTLDAESARDTPSPPLFSSMVPRSRCPPLRTRCYSPPEHRAGATAGASLHSNRVRGHPPRAGLPTFDASVVLRGPWLAGWPRRGVASPGSSALGWIGVLQVYWTGKPCLRPCVPHSTFKRVVVHLPH
jgi:hypothetical protein